MKALILGTAFLLATAAPAAAQTSGVGSSSLGVGLVFGSIGVGVDYGKVIREMTGGKTLAIVGEGTFSHEGCGGLGFECGANMITVQAGPRFGGAIGTDGKLTWHGQVLAGIARFSVTGDLDETCDILDIGCSSTDVVVTPGFGIGYKLNETTSFIGRVNVQIAGGTSGGLLWLGVAWSK